MNVQVVFAWAKDVTSQQQIDEAVSGAEVRLFGSELEMLQAWLAFFMEADPDALILFQVRLDPSGLFSRLNNASCRVLG